VLIDGRDVRRLALSSLRGAVGLVPQDTFLFSDTLAANIALGSANGRGDNDAAIAAVSAISRIDQDVAEFPHAYATIVGERGVTLSGGQKQRTAIARALIRDPRILILDDALSSVDVGTEQEILAGLRSFRAGRTTILISHRISTIKDADLIAVLQDGRVVEQGTHAALLALDGVYADLYEKQLIRDALEAEDGTAET
jgi:ATP-binding cassette, subfamily B, multidrug efflux pump